MVYRVYFADGNQRLLEGDSIFAIVRHITEVEPLRNRRLQEMFPNDPEVLELCPVRKPAEIIRIEVVTSEYN